uniref:TP6A_N domain-containing protein n=1 Tax=Macrostomum lignano TaxID=282301 RepID=A0A1I8HLQ4_9PLAT
MTSCDSSEVTSLASTSARTATGAIQDSASSYTHPTNSNCRTSPRQRQSLYAPLQPEDADNPSTVVSKARQLIAELQDLLNSPTTAAPVGASAATSSKTNSNRNRLQTNEINNIEITNSARSFNDASSSTTQHTETDSALRAQQPQQPEEPPLELQACNGLCVVFANYASLLPASTAAMSSNSNGPTPADGTATSATQPTAEADPASDEEDDMDAAAADGGSPRQLLARANQIRDAATAIGRLFNSRLEFTVFIHWNKSRRETLRLLRQTASAMSESGRDCCFVFCLGRGGRDHFEAASGGSVTLTDILATLAVGQRGRLPPVFVVGELTPVTTTAYSAAASVETPRLSIPSNHLLLWSLGAPEMTDLLVEQLTKTHSGSNLGKDVASTVAGIAEWIRRRRNGTSSARGVGGDRAVLCGRNSEDGV